MAGVELRQQWEPTAGNP